MRHQWLLGGAVVLGVLLLGTTAKAAFDRDDSEADLDALTRMLIAETGFTSSKAEMAQIVFIAVNRARRNGKTLREVVTPPGTPTWNVGALYRKRFIEAMQNPRWTAARLFVQDVLDGVYVNGGFTSFVHPAGMPTPPCSSNRVEASTVAGVRCIPDWITKGRVVGSAMFA
jgi:hypothetical protein